MIRLTDNYRGAALMVASMSAFTINDACMKALSDELPLMQALFMRGVGTTLLMVALAYGMGQLRFDFSRRDWGLIALRSLAETAGAYFFLNALFNMPIADISAIMQSLPLTVTLAGALFLREAVGWRRMLAILIGFAGVMLIVRPGGEGFSVFSIYGLLSVALMTVRDLVVRRMSKSVPTLMVALFAAISVTAFTGALSFTIDWQPMSTLAGTQMAAAMVFLIGGYVFSVSAMRFGDIAFVSPFRYTSLLVALVLGFLVFGEWPDRLTQIGALIVVAMGLFTLYRESRVKR